jgi:hypothetical protein
MDITLSIFNSFEHISPMPYMKLSLFKILDASYYKSLLGFRVRGYFSHCYIFRPI